MNWLIISIYWYLALFFLGIIFFPLTKKIFGKVFYEFGYPFSKVLAILFLSYSIFILSTFKILPFTQKNLVVIIFVFMLINFYLLKKKPSANTNHQQSIIIIIFEELLFLFSFLFWVYVRGQEPSIRGLEKFMDFGFINAILRTKFFPPIDVWLPPHHINYYYFGHLTGAVLIRFTGLLPAIGYNLILATLFALGTTLTFSLVFNICYQYLKESSLKPNKFSLFIKLIFFGLTGSFIVNLGGNLHTIYAFTSGYPNEKPIPFWQIFSNFNPTKYWYPNATRFIPFTIHEFPSYSYVVADLHGHVFDIPFILLTLALLFKIFITFKQNSSKTKDENAKLKIKKILNTKYLILNTIFLGFLTAVHYMTNAFDGPIYLLLAVIVFFYFFGLSLNFLVYSLVLIAAFLIYSLPFSLKFSPFASSIGVNCSFGFLTKIGKIGPFLFEKNNCQLSPPWMLFVLWGFFWIAFIIFLKINKKSLNPHSSPIIKFIFLLFSFSTFLVIIPEFFYIKDIYPNHFRANTMFKLGYQAFIMMGIASAFVFFQIKFLSLFKRIFWNFIFLFFFFFVAIYPFFSIPSYYGFLAKKPVLDGTLWFNSFYPEDKEIIDYLNKRISGQPVILEAQGDSYTDYERISANTGLPTVAGWWVHEWLWRGSANAVGKRIPDIVVLYESNDLALTKELIKKYQIKFIIVSGLEKEKYNNLNLNKLNTLARVIFRSQNNKGVIYQVNPDKP